MKRAWQGVAVIAAGLVVSCAGQVPENALDAQSRQSLAQAILSQNQPSLAPVPIPFILGDTEKGCLKAAPITPRVRQEQVVQWFIVNDCTEDVSIELDNFRLKGTTRPELPFEEGRTSCTARAGQLCVPIITLRTLREKSDGAKGAFVFEYDVLLNGTKVDPEIIIEWF